MWRISVKRRSDGNESFSDEITLEEAMELLKQFSKPAAFGNKAFILTLIYVG